jgi:mRNA interferase MazF
VLILGRDEVLDQLGEVIVVPATRTIRGLGTEVVLAPEEGMPVACALNFDHLGIVQKGRLGAVITELSPSRWQEAREALLVACGFGGR